LKRQQVRIVVDSAAPAFAIYRLLKDGRTWPDWSVLDECVPEGIPAGVEEQIGTLRISRRGRTRGEDRITELVPGRRFGYQHVKGLPVVDYEAFVDLTPKAGGGTEIVWEAAFVPRWPGTGAVLRRGIGKFLNACARGLAEHAPADPHEPASSDITEFARDPVSSPPRGALKGLGDGGLISFTPIPRRTT
jgi:hypothetical protein